MPRFTISVDLLPDPLADRLRRFIRPKDLSSQHVRGKSPQNAHHRSQGQSTESHSSGLFNQASNFTINNPVMVENHTGIVNVNHTVFATGKPALERLEPYTEPGAAMDSSARDPPPKCHPGTRLKISGRLEKCLDTVEREWNMIWLHGSAGTGKSAVAQTFAEYCSERGRLGAAFFFSRSNDRNKPETVIPTLAYQLAVHCRSYNSALTDQLISDPQLLKKTPRVQLKKLIIDPLLLLQAGESTRIREPFMIILDGLDECEGERAQFEFVNMVNETAQLKNLPLLWLICSRPEEHLQYTFSRVASYRREELLLDKESRDDVDRYLRDELARIKDEFRIIAPSPWPSEDQLDALSGSASGLFVFASTGLEYIGDPTYANPVERLKKLLSFLNHIDAVGSNNPLASLDLLYTQILTDVPKDVYPTTWRILAHSTWLNTVVSGSELTFAAQRLCNFLRLDQSTFYSALRKLHSVIAVPAPKDAFKVPLFFRHASFRDFLSDPNRSGRFVIEEKRALIDIAKSYLFWHNLDVTHFHTDDGWKFDYEHRHASLPHLKWVSPDNETSVSMAIAGAAEECWPILQRCYDEKDDDLLLLIHSSDVRYLRYCFPYLANWISQQYPSDPIVRAKPSNQLDMRLLDYMRTVIGQGPADPAIFPVTFWVNLPRRRRTYFFVGHGEKTTIVWLTECGVERNAHTLTSDQEPSLERIREYQDWLVQIKWNDTLDWKEGDSGLSGSPSEEESESGASD